MAVWRRVAPVALALVLALTFLSGCAGSGTDGSEAAHTEATEQGEGSSAGSDESGGEVETEVAGKPAGFPADVPLHPGTVTDYEPMEVTDTTTVHQLTIESAASFDDVIAWYETKLPAGWSVGYLEELDRQGREAKIALDGGSYTPASPDGLGGGMIIGVFDNEPTLIVTTVTVMGAP